METLVYLLYGMLGVIIGSLLSILPGLHPLNFAGIGVFLYLAFPMDPLGMALIFAGMLIAYAIVGTITTTFMGSPDDSTMYMAFPNQKYLMYGRGYEASVATGIGSMGSVVLLLMLAPFAGTIFPIFRKLLTPHFHWVLIGVTVYILQSEWPKDWGSRAKTRFGRLKDGWASLSAGWVTFFLAMMLGFIVLNVPITPIDKAFQNIMPVFVGFFAVPWVLTNMASRVDIPPQTVSNTFYISKKDLARGTTSGFLGGMFAAYQPIVTAGIGGVLAGHSTSTQGDVQFMISGSAGRFAYYVGAFFLFWVPLLHLTRGGMAWITGVIYQPRTDSEFCLLMAAIAVAAVFAFMLLVFLSRVVAKVIAGFSFKKISIAVLIGIILLVFWFSGLEGLVILTIATGLGLVPPMFRTRRLNLILGFFFPIFLNMAGLGAGISRFLGVY
ncbi:MAG: tripartite tricarboxylate transporter permease [Hadesarchaea archaeon]|nr:tripartite tricarboxylate transporter permease [Hadesarchaea archaeon]